MAGATKSLVFVHQLGGYSYSFPKQFFDQELAVLPNDQDLHKQVTEILCMFVLDERFRFMDRCGAQAQIFSIGPRQIEVSGAATNVDETA